MELLAPAGDRTSLIAAVQNGADAVYLGARGFNARRGADNFDGDALCEAVNYCHIRDVKVYVTLNTMVRQDEFDELERTVEEIYLSGADAFIVQDLGVAQVARRVAPDMALHASTQMAIHNAQGVDYVRKMGFTRAVLAREMTFEEIKQCAGRGVQLEVFGHGALCVSCSGQCLLSSMIGGRSGNRGMCAQPCRMKYRMDGVEGYLLSPRDLMTADIMRDFCAANVDSLKIEGRLKRPEYVAVVTGIYRRAIDGESITELDVNELRQIFNRGGFTHGYGPGAHEESLMYRYRPNNNGVEVGRASRGIVALDSDVEYGDSLVLRCQGDDIPVRLSGARGEKVRCADAQNGARLVRLTSNAQLRRARDTWEMQRRCVEVSAKLTLRVGEPMKLVVSKDGHVASAEGSKVQSAQRRPLDRARVEAQLRRTGGTAYVFGAITLDADENAFAAVSEINNLRRDALDEMTRVLCRNDRIPGSIENVRPLSRVNADKPLLRAQSGSITALRLAAQSGADELVFAPEDMRALDMALQLDRFYLALPQVLCEKELRRVNDWAAAHAEHIMGVYAANVSHLALSWPGRLIADYTMNIANELSADQTGAAEFSPSVELTSRQIDALGGKKDILVYGYLPLMQLRHCPYRASHDIAGAHAKCCMCDERPRLTYLEDRTGTRFPLRRIASDAGCIIQLMNSVPLMLLRRIDRLPDAHAWRIMIDESSADVTSLYRLALDGRDYTKDPKWAKYDEMRSTTGHYFRGVE